MTAALCATSAWSADPGETAEQGLKRCRAVSEAAARLACYDALSATPARSAAAAATAVAAPAAVATAPAGAKATVPSGPMASPAVAAVAPTPAAQPLESSFGLGSPAASLQAISSSLPGTFLGWERTTRFRLANGQVWQVIDGTSVAAYLKDPKVTVRRAALGSFLMEFEGLTTAVRVQRVE